MGKYFAKIHPPSRRQPLTLHRCPHFLHPRPPSCRCARINLEGNHVSDKYSCVSSPPVTGDKPSTASHHGTSGATMTATVLRNIELIWKWSLVRYAADYIALHACSRLATLTMLTSSHAFSPGPAAYVAAGFLAYFLCARWLRWRNYLAIHRKFGAKFLNGGLTVQDAQEIVQVSGMWDMPALLYFALSYATIKTYAIVGQQSSQSS